MDNKIDLTASSTVQDVSNAFINIFRAVERAQSKGIFELREAHALYQNAVTLENYINAAREAAGLIQKDTPKVEEV